MASCSSNADCPQLESGCASAAFDTCVPYYDAWLPGDGIEVTITATYTPNSATPVSFMVVNVTNWQGKYTNDPSTDPAPPDNSDFFCNGSPCIPNTTVSGTGNTITLKSLDYGASITLRATAGGIEKDITLPKDTIGYGLPDAWQKVALGILGYKPADDPDGDGLTNLKEYRGFVWGQLDRVDPQNSNGKYQTTAFVPQSGVSHFRTHPMRKDLFVKFRYFDWDHPFAIGAAFYNAGIDVHALNYDLSDSARMREADVGVLLINNNGADAFPDSTVNLDAPYHQYGHIAHRTGRVRDWEWATKGVCPPGNTTAYGTCTAYQLALDNYFQEKPYTNGQTCPSSSTNCSGSPWPQWTSPNTVLDPINRVEDQNDNTVNNRIGSNNYEAGPSANSTWHTDVRVPGSFVQAFNPFNPSNITDNVELPAGSQYTKAQVLKHTITHEIVHGAGDGPHNSDSTCLMYEWSNNWSRDNFLSKYAKGLLKIHNP